MYFLKISNLFFGPSYRYMYLDKSLENVLVFSTRLFSCFFTKREWSYFNTILASGFSKHPYNNGGRCGFHLRNWNYFLSWSIDASYWCDPASSKPCCTNAKMGWCVSESKCPKNGINLAKYVHAELSDWVLHDKRLVFHILPDNS